MMMVSKISTPYHFFLNEKNLVPNQDAGYILMEFLSGRVFRRTVIIEIEFHTE